MNKSLAAITLALAGTFAAGAADAHGYGHHDNHRGPEFRVIIQPQQRYYAPPPQYYAPPPVYVEPVEPEVDCRPIFNRYGEEVGSIQRIQDPYSGRFSRPYRSPELCY